MIFDQTQNEPLPYSDLTDFQNIYLEDSFVLDVEKLEKEIVFQVEFVLTETHPQYERPRTGENYCYRCGEIRFSNVKDIRVFKLSDRSFQDSSREHDLGNIDIFTWNGNEYHLSGDWGEMDVNAEEVKVSLREH